MDNNRLKQQIDWTIEIDKMTHVERRTLLIDGSRRENDAEHSWHIATMCLLFSEYLEDAPNVNTEHAASLCLTHDLVEIYAGDTFAFDKEGNKTKATREQDAARRLFSLLPKEQGKKISALWIEFEKMQTPESRLANCMDRLQPFIHNLNTNGHTWLEAKATTNDVRARMEPIKLFMPKLWLWVEEEITKNVSYGWIIE